LDVFVVDQHVLFTAARSTQATLSMHDGRINTAHLNNVHHAHEEVLCDD
jgi:hypothetical protein